MRWVTNSEHKVPPEEKEDKEGVPRPKPGRTNPTS